MFVCPKNLTHNAQSKLIVSKCISDIHACNSFGSDRRPGLEMGGERDNLGQLV